MRSFVDATDLNGSSDPSQSAAAAASGDHPFTEAVSAATPTDASLPLPRRGLLDRDWQRVLDVLQTLLAGLSATLMIAMRGCALRGNIRRGLYQVVEAVPQRLGVRLDLEPSRRRCLSRLAITVADARRGAR